MFPTLLAGVRGEDAVAITQQLNRAYITEEGDLQRMHGAVVEVIVQGALRSASASDTTRDTVLAALRTMGIEPTF